MNFDTTIEFYWEKDRLYYGNGSRKVDITDIISNYPDLQKIDNEGIIDLSIAVEFNYSEREKPCFSREGKVLSPGYPESVEVYEIIADIEGEALDISDMLDVNSIREDLEEQAFENHRENS